MFGYSVYVSMYNSPDDVPSGKGEMCFTSMHLAEEFFDGYREKSLGIFKAIHDKGSIIMVDISPVGIEALGFKNLLEFMDATHVDIVRCDYGFTNEELIEAGKHAAIALNASTNDYEVAKTLLKEGVKVYACHNFYPRPETGLDEDFFLERNKELKQMGLEPMAFISGDKVRRIPLELGLPTLERHRDLKPYIQYVELKEIYGVNEILVGDPQISDKQKELIRNYEKDHIISLPVRFDDEHNDLYGKVFTIRSDSPRKFARLGESRQNVPEFTVVEPKNCVERKLGYITMDNSKYLRYSGEIQIVREDAEANERINVIGEIIDEYKPIVSVLNRNTKIRFIKG